MRDDEYEFLATVAREIELFRWIEVRCAFDFKLRIRTRNTATSDGKQVRATLTAPTLDVIRFEELKEYAAKFKDFTFAFGAPAHGSWQFID